MRQLGRRAFLGLCAVAATFVVIAPSCGPPPAEWQMGFTQGFNG